MTENNILPDYGFQTIIEEASEGVIISKAMAVATDNFEIVYVNRAMERISGYTRKELIGKTSLIFQCEATSAETKSKIQQHLKNRQPAECNIINARKNGELYWAALRIVPIKNQQGEVTHFATYQRDITNQHQFDYGAPEDNHNCLLTEDAFLKVLETEWGRSYRHHSTFSVLCIRAINLNQSPDSNLTSHPTANINSEDNGFTALAGICRQLFRKEDTVGCIGINEYAVLMPETGLQHAAGVVNRLKNTSLSTPGLSSLVIQTGVAELDLLDQATGSIMARAREYSELY